MLTALCARLLAWLLNSLKGHGKRSRLLLYLFKKAAGSSAEARFTQALWTELQIATVQEINRLLHHARKLVPASWIPEELRDRQALVEADFDCYVVFDLEYNPRTDTITEAAVLVWSKLRCNETLTWESATDAPQSEILGELAASLNHALAPRHGQAILVGHNILRFDIPLLEKRGVELPPTAILDTLELSLLTRPLRPRHALDGEHHALADVRKNLELLRDLTQYWQTTPTSELRWHMAQHPGDTGLGIFFRHTLDTLSEQDDALESIYLDSLRAGAEVHPPSVPPTMAIPMSWDAFLCDTQPNTLRRAPTPLTPELLHALINGPQKPALALAVSKWTLHAYRTFLKRVDPANGLCCPHTFSSTDVCIDLNEAVDALAESSGGFATSFLARWLAAGGRWRHEIHPLISDLAGDDQPLLDQRAFSAPPSIPSVARVIDHLTLVQHRQPAPALVLETEVLEEIAVEACGQHAPLTHPSEDAVVAALVFIETRTLGPERNAHGTTAVIVKTQDTKDTAWTALLQDCRNNGSLDAAHFVQVAQRVADPGCVVILGIRHADCGPTISLTAIAPDDFNTFRQRVRALRGTCAFATGPHLPLSLHKQVEQLVDHSLEAAAELPDQPTRVLQNSWLGTPTALPRALSAICQWLLHTSSADPQHSLATLGGGDDLHRVISTTLRACGLPAFTASHYGWRDRTIGRLADHKAVILAASARPLPLPENTHQAVILRLPFPSHTDPAIIAALACLDNTDDGFSAVILPHMLRRLLSAINALRTAHTEPIVADARALKRFSYRREIEMAIGRVQACKATLSPEMQHQLDEALASALRNSPLANTTMSLADVDPTPVFVQWFGTQATWRPGQEGTVKRILAGERLLTIMPTGTGKSVCYQLPAHVAGALNEQLTVVISPLKALMDDQVSSLTRRGVLGVAAYHSDIVDPERRARSLANVRNGWTTILYIAPEQLLNPVVQDALLERGVDLFVIDEAHCLSEWGHDFRPDYRKIPDILRMLASARAEQRPQVSAFTATAPTFTQADICELLGLSCIDHGSRRTNITAHIEPLETDAPLPERLERLCAWLREKPTTPQHAESGIVYGRTRTDVEEIAAYLAAANLPGYPPETIAWYHAGLNRNERARRAEGFIRSDGSIRLIVATTALGMGIDKPDVHWVAHVHAPDSVEAYAQQIGRAARDPAIQGHTYMACSTADPARWQWMMTRVSEAQVRKLLTYLRGGNLLATLPAVLSLAQLAIACDFDTQGRGRDYPITKAALFALDRAGIIHIDCRMAASLRVRRGPVDADGPLDPFDQAILKYVAENGDVLLNLCQLPVPETLSLPPEEANLRILALVAGRLLQRCEQVRVSPSDLTREEALARFQTIANLYQRFTNAIQEQLVRSDGRYFDMPFLEQEAIVGPDTNHGWSWFEDIVMFMAMRSIIQIRRYGLRLRVNRGTRTAMATRANTELQELRALLIRVYEDTSNPDGTPPASPNPTEDRVTAQRLSILAKWHLVSWHDERSYHAAYKIDACSSPADDTERLAQLNFTRQRFLDNQRNRALHDLVSQPRHGDGVWDFIDEYFHGNRLGTFESEAISGLLAGLTDEQRAAVSAPPTAPLLINAVAGSGKTHVLARRIAYLQIAYGVDGRRIIVLSFSRAGTQSIARRYQIIAHDLGLPQVRCQTFHGFCYGIYHQLGGRRSVVGSQRLPQRLRSSDRQLRHLNNRRYNAIFVRHFDRLFDGIGYADSAQAVAQYASAVDSVRSGNPQLGRAVTHAADFDAFEHVESLQLPDGTSLLLSNVRTVLERYQTILDETNQIDFANMVAGVLRKMRENPRAVELVQLGIDHLLVDEFQDTSCAQDELMRLVLGPRSGITVVGDDDQTIYSFAGSSVYNILAFQERNSGLWPDLSTQVLPLQENFRSTPRILETAAHVIANNTNRLGKTIRPYKGMPAPPRDAYRRCNAFVRIASAPSMGEAVDRAVALIQEWVATDGVPAQDIAVLSRINPHSNLENALLDRIEGQLRKQGIPLARSGNSGRASTTLIAFVRALVEHHGEIPLTNLAEAAPPPRRRRPSGLAQVVASALQRGLTQTTDLLEELESDAHGVAVPERDQGGVHLLTIHQAKGLEFRRVIVLYLGSYHFPYFTATDTEEERRLLYVAITRAEEQLILIGESGTPFYDEVAGAPGVEEVAEPADDVVEPEPPLPLPEPPQHLGSPSAPTTETPTTTTEAPGPPEDPVDPSPPGKGNTNTGIDGFNAWFNE